MKWLFLFSLLVIISIQLVSCNGSRLGYAAGNEKLDMQVKEKRDVIDYSKLSIQRIPGFKARLQQRSSDTAMANGAKNALPIAPMLGGLVSLATNGVKKMIDNDKKKYTAAYDFALTKLYFYDQLSTESMFDPVGMQFHGFTLVRTFKTNEGKEDTALVATFVLDTANAYEIINNAVFRLRLKDIELRYAKAKIAKGAKQIINMDMEISFFSSYVNEMGQLFDNMPLGKFYFLLRDAPLDKKVTGYDAYYQKLKGSLLDGRSFIVPRSFGYYIAGNGDRAKCYSQGAYSIHVKVNESSKNTFVNKIIIDNSSQILNSAESGLKKLIND